VPETVEEQLGDRSREISLAFFDTLFATGPFGLALLDRHGRYERVNGALAEMHGIDADAHAGRTVEEVLPDLADQLRDPFATVLAGGEPRTVEIRGETAARPGVRGQWVISWYPVLDGDGVMLGVGMVVLEITAQRDAEGQRSRLLDLERAARAAAQRARERAAFLAEAGVRLDASLDLRTTLDTLARIAVPTLADWCTIHLLEGNEIRCAAIAHSDRARESLAWEIEARYPAALGSPGGPGAVIRTGEAEHVREVTDREIGAVSTDAEHGAMLRRLGLSASLVLPLSARERVLGAIGFALAEPGRQFSAEDVKLAEETVRRAALALDNARLYSDRSRVARTLQQSLLPTELPAMPGIDAAGRFRAAGDGGEVGGDFYDVFGCGERCWAAVIGDVCGKGAVAATLTSLARHTVRAAARYETGPAILLGALNDAILAQKREDMRFLTAMFVRMAPRDGRIELSYARGGHVPPLILRAGGTVETLLPEGPLLGIVEDAVLEEQTATLAPGDALVLYTDGVTEAGAPANPLGEERLGELLAGCAGADADGIADAIVQTALEIQDGRPRDDIAVLVLRCRPS